MNLKQGTNMDLPKEYFLYFKLADNNEAVYPLSALRRVSCSANAKLDFHFDTANFLPTGTTTTTTDSVRCSITADTEAAIMKAFAAEVNGNMHKYKNSVGNYLIVGDQVAGSYFHADVTAVDSITRAA